MVLSQAIETAYLELVTRVDQQCADDHIDIDVLIMLHKQYLTNIEKAVINSNVQKTRRILAVICSFSEDLGQDYCDEFKRLELE